LLGDPVGSARFKSRPEDFEVEEILGFEPTGEGEHALLWVEKVDRNSNDVAAQFAKRLGLRRRLVNHCGLKDKFAVTRQWFSLHLPGLPTPPAESLEGDNVKVLASTRNLRKLRRGCHQGNRFAIRLRDCDLSPEAAVARWGEIERRGVPNYFGPQRFGRDGGNIELAKRFFAGEFGFDDRSPPDRLRPTMGEQTDEQRFDPSSKSDPSSRIDQPLRIDRALRGILISAARSLLFNACVAQRVEAGIWDEPIEGEVFGFSHQRSLVIPSNRRGDEIERFRQGMLELTAPLWGEGELLSFGTLRDQEIAVAGSYPEIIAGLSRFNLRQERRVIRLRPLNSSLDWEGPRTLVLRFELPKGAYATTLLREFVRLEGDQSEAEED
jgi:tRNA pseudouridine13 synthase